MRKYLVFMGNEYYPMGGWEDYSGSFESHGEALIYLSLQDSLFRWAHIVFDGKIITKFTSGDTPEGIYISMKSNEKKPNWILEEIP